MKKSPNLKPGLQGSKSQDKLVPKPPKNTTNRPHEIQQKQPLRRNMFCNNFHTKTSFQESHMSRYRITNASKPEAKMKFEPSMPACLSKWGSKLVSKSLKTRFQTLTCSSCWSHSSDKCSQAAKMVSQGAKIDVPSLANKSLGHIAD